MQQIINANVIWFNSRNVIENGKIVKIMALLIAAKFLGFWGVILAPAMAAVVCTLLDELYIKPISDIA